MKARVVPARDFVLLVLAAAAIAWSHVCLGVDLDKLANPVWVHADNLRDPAVLPVRDGYVLFYSRFSGNDWGKVESWSVAKVFTKDWKTFEDQADVTPKGYASPGDPVLWHGRHVLPFQSYPTNPTRLCYSESQDARSWSRPHFFLPEANTLPWNTLKRAIDPCLVVDGDTLHCFFVGSAPLPGGGHANLLGHALTRDENLKDWQVLTKDLPLIGQGQRAPDGVENVTVFKTGSLWTMIYSEGMKDQHLAYAQSPDLTRWTLKGPIPLARQKWMRRRYGAPFVWREPDRWVMILMGTGEEGRTTFGLLHSADGIGWSLLPERK